MNLAKGGITAPLGFLASGVSCGIKRRGRDVALIFSQRPATVAGTLTTNRLRAPCVAWTEKILRRGTAQAIVANSGNANCCTGSRGIKDTATVARWVGQHLGLSPSKVIVASTGVIGQFLPMDRARKGITLAASRLNRRGSLLAVEAIMTTDTRPKEIALRFSVGGRLVTLGGIAKGSGMVSPCMATMLAFLTTDAKVGRPTLTRALKAAVNETFNAITIDGELSTNDMVILLANGVSEAPVIREGSPAYRDFQAALRAVCQHLAHEIVRDGEGVTRLFRVQVTRAVNFQSARQVARRVADSLLVKTMVAGRDPNWGRIAAAVGASSIPVDPRKLIIRLGHTVVYRKGEPTAVSKKQLLKEVDQAEVQVGIDLGSGRAQAAVLSGDLTDGYVRINAKYTT